MYLNINFFYLPGGAPIARIRENSRLMQSHVSIIYWKTYNLIVLLSLWRNRSFQLCAAGVLAPGLPMRKQLVCCL